MRTRKSIIGFALAILLVVSVAMPISAAQVLAPTESSYQILSVSTQTGSTDIPDILAAAQEGETLTVHLKNTDSTEKYLCMALYASDGKMLAMQKTAVAGGTEQDFTFPATSNTASLKVFLLNASLQPLCRAFTTDVIPVTSITLDKTSVKLVVDEDCTLTCTILPTNATDRSVQWASADSSIAFVNSEGKVTAKHAGTTTVTATTSNGKQATCTVRVEVKEDENETPRIPIQ